MVPRWMVSGRETIVEGVLGTSDASLFLSADWHLLYTCDALRVI